MKIKAQTIFIINGIWNYYIKLEGSQFPKDQVFKGIGYHTKQEAILAKNNFIGQLFKEHNLPLNILNKTPLKGKNFESNIISYLSKYCNIIKGDVYDHNFKLDGIITGFKNIDLKCSIGIQITSFKNDDEKQAEFLNIYHQKKITDKCLYFKFEDMMTNYNDITEILYSIILSFTQDTNFENYNTLGVYIRKDLKYHYFTLNSVIKTNDIINGKIVIYRKEKNMGFIFSGDKKWFFHIGSIEDQFLLDLLNRIKTTENMLNEYIPVTFVDAGYKKIGSKCPTAIDVKPIYV